MVQCSEKESQLPSVLARVTLLRITRNILTTHIWRQLYKRKRRIRRTNHKIKLKITIVQDYNCSWFHMLKNKKPQKIKQKPPRFWQSSFNASKRCVINPLSLTEPFSFNLLASCNVQCDRWIFPPLSIETRWTWSLMASLDTWSQNPPATWGKGGNLSTRMWRNEVPVKLP